MLKPKPEADADSVDPRRFTALPKRGVKDDAPTQQADPEHEEHVQACEGAPGVVSGLLLTLLVAPRACVAWPVLGDPFADAANGRKLVSARTRHQPHQDRLSLSVRLSFTRQSRSQDKVCEVARVVGAAEIRGKNDIQRDGRMARCLVGGLRLLTGDAPARREEATPGPCLPATKTRPTPAVAFPLARLLLFHTCRPVFILLTLATIII